MIRRLMGFLVVALAVVAAGYFYYLHQWQQQVDSFAHQIRMLGGELDYSAIAINHHGEASLKDVYLKVPLQPIVVRVDRVVVHTDGLLGLYYLERDSRRERLPDTLGFSLEGLHLGLSNLIGQAHVSPLQPWLTAGCDGQGFSEDDYRAMGYREWVLDLHANYQLESVGAGWSLKAETLLQDAYSLGLEIQLALDAASPQLEHIIAALPQARFTQASMDYSDKGLLARMETYCLQQKELKREDYFSAQLQYWQSAWNTLGATPAEDFKQAYHQFLQQPQQWRWSMIFTPPFGLAELMQDTPSRWLEQATLTATVNRKKPLPVDLQIKTRPVVSAEQSSESSAAKDKPAQTDTATAVSQPAAPHFIAVDALGDYVKQQVTVDLRDGQQLSGRIEVVEHGWLQLQRHRRAGYFVQPVRVEDIAQVQLH